MHRPLGRNRHGRIALAAGLVLAAGCSGNKPASTPRTQDLYVFAAASLKETFGKLKAAFESAHPGVHVILNFAGSQTLALQITNGAPCNVFASADAVQMKMAEVGQRIDPANVLEFASNRLVVVAPPNSKVASFQDLTKQGVKIVIADAKVPAGEYAQLTLAKAGSSFASAAFKNVVSKEQDVRAVLTKVELGEADAGIVYLTDAMVAPPTIRVINIPAKDAVDSEYFIAPLDGPELDLSKSFVSLVMSPEGQNTLAGAGFIVSSK